MTQNKLLNKRAGGGGGGGEDELEPGQGVPSHVPPPQPPWTNPSEKVRTYVVGKY